MPKRQLSSGRRGGNFPLSEVLNSKSRSSPLLSLSLVILGAYLLIIYAFGGSGIMGGRTNVVSKVQVLRAIPVLKKVYRDRMKKVLHVSPDSCSIVSKLLREEETEAWGVEPYDIEDADRNCMVLMQKGIISVVDIKFPLPYRAKSFSHFIVSHALDYLSPRYSNKTLPELARVSVDGIVIFTGYLGQQKAKVAQLSKLGRLVKTPSSSWWSQFFVQMNLVENEAAIEDFEQAASKMSYKPSCQIFHLSSHH